ncbi:Uncharacterized protein Adt_31609 [Abeliophyllum distichum]|uniref:Uncharacterized protein n=1 Tax=Abeliophyllum distichum TaxID=126358 RepID=A0ABD1RER2_9LAMI
MQKKLLCVTTSARKKNSESTLLYLSPSRSIVFVSRFSPLNQPSTGGRPRARVRPPLPCWRRRPFSSCVYKGFLICDWVVVQKISFLLVTGNTGGAKKKRLKAVIILLVVGTFAMSRCFPFPPPGYERKHPPEDLDLLREEKCKEKKHKKEKKDKENREGREKRDKDRSEGKHREKRSRKEKHKDKNDKNRNKKKDEEDRGKDKEKSSISEESAVAGKFEERNGESLHPTVHKKATGSSLDEAKHATQLRVQNRGKPVQNNLISQELKESKFVLDPDSTIINQKKEPVSELLERVSGCIRKGSRCSKSCCERIFGIIGRRQWTEQR